MYDRRLEPLIASGGADSEIERLLVGLAAPLIRQILSRYFRAGGPLPVHDAEDVAATVNLRLLHKLRRVVSSPDEPIQDLTNYVATLAYNTVNDYLRRRFPERARLKNRLRYVLTHDARLALWSAPAGLVAGLKSWSGSMAALTAVPLEPAQATRAMLDRSRPADALSALFETVGTGIELEALLAFAADLWNVTDVVQAAPEAGAEPPAPERLERQEFLRALWREIEALRPMQRKALLLNLRDEETVNVVSLLVLTGIAKTSDVAAALEMTPEQLAAIWNDLPLDDRRIAELLGLTRQQVINLRKSARERLTRRLFK